MGGSGSFDHCYQFVRERVRAGELKLVHLPTSEQVADVLTKPLAKTQFRKLVDILMKGHGGAMPGHVAS